jgi:hypothetical protein
MCAHGDAHVRRITVAKIETVAGPETDRLIGIRAQPRTHLEENIAAAGLELSDVEFERLTE